LQTLIEAGFEVYLRPKKPRTDLDLAAAQIFESLQRLQPDLGTDELRSLARQCTPLLGGFGHRA
jgi:hypothetical protein